MRKASNENFILKIIRYVPIIAILIMSPLITLMIYTNYIDNLKKEKEKIAKEYIDFNKELIKNNINTISQYINNKHSLTSDILKKQIKDQVYAAHELMSSLYNEFKDTKTKEEITLIIKSALKNMKFNKGNSYYFIYDLDGVGVFHPVKPEREGKNLFDTKDSKGTLIVQEVIAIVKNDKGEGYRSWMFSKPNDHSQEYEKVGFVKKFKPYDWIIGTGEYVDEFDNQIKQEIIDYIRDIGYKDTGYTFVIDKKANFLLTRTKYSNVNDIDPKNVFIKEYNDFVNSNREDTYLEYEFVNVNNEYSGKISYIKKIKEYDWVIGTGFNADNLNLKIKEKQEVLENQFNDQIKVVLIISLSLTIILLTMSILVSRTLSNRFLQYKEDLENQILENQNQKEVLLRAQEVAHLGDWKLNIETNKSIYSDEIIRIFGLDTKDKDKFGPEYLKNIMIIEDKVNFDNFINNCTTASEEQKCIYRVIRPNDNEIVWVESRAKLDKDKLSVIGTIQDISENKILEIEKSQREELFYQQSKMAAMGEMIGNIAHQWRQPLSVISTASTGAKLQKEMNILSDDELLSSLTAINTSAQYLSSTIEDFRDFFNPSNNKINEFDISDAISKTLNLVKAQFTAKNIEIIQNIEEYKVSSIENELIQVLINILNNARDALLTIENQKRFIFINVYTKESNLIIEIKDNADGIKKDIMDRVFEPYFTTKHKAQGTGIGLYMSKEIIEKHLDGNLLVTNENYTYENVDYLGAKFVIEIPNMEVER